MRTAGVGLALGASGSAGGGQFIAGVDSIEDLAGPGVCGELTVAHGIGGGGALCFSLDGTDIVWENWWAELYVVSGEGASFGASYTVTEVAVVEPAEVVSGLLGQVEQVAGSIGGAVGDAYDSARDRAQSIVDSVGRRLLGPTPL
ncbi:MAG: hypothetical protein GY720_20315 [bacterium]|nr:hypothetical protein [bacterium]